MSRAYGCCDCPLSKDLPDITGLPQSALLSIIEAQRQIDDTARADYAPAVLAFAKALEILLRDHVFVPFQQQIRARRDFAQLLLQASQDEFSKAAAFTKFIEKGAHLELGSMSFTLALCTGKTSQRMGLMSEFRQFIFQDLQKDKIINNSFSEQVSNIARQYRNPAAHAESFGRSAAQDARAQVLAALRIVLDSPSNENQLATN